MSSVPSALSLTRVSEPWLTAEEAMQLLRWSRATFFRRRSELVSRQNEGRTEYLCSSFPQRAAQTQLAIVAPAACVTGPLFAAEPCSMERIVLSDPASQARAQKRLAALEPILAFPDDPGRYRTLTLRDGRQVTSLERMIEYSAEIHAQSPRTIKRWLAAYRSKGFTALADRIRQDKGQSRWFARYPKAAILAAFLYFNERQSVSFVTEQIEHEGALLGLPEDDLPARETVRVFLSGAPAPLRVLAREGQREFRERMAPYLKRGYVDVFANQIQTS